MKTATVYIFPMRKREFQWQVIRLRAKGEYLGRVSAPDEETAIKVAIKTFDIRDPAHQKRLLVRRYA